VLTQFAESAFIPVITLASSTEDAQRTFAEQLGSEFSIRKDELSISELRSVIDGAVHEVEWRRRLDEHAREVTRLKAEIDQLTSEGGSYDATADLDSYIDVEPLSGVTMFAKKQLQLNVWLPKAWIISDAKTFFGTPNPTLFPEYSHIFDAVADKKILENAVGDLTKIAGQKPVITKAKKSIATFKLRKGYPVGCMVTLRGTRMYEFLDRLVTIAMPRIRDFRGISNRAFDGRGNYSVGFKEQIIFPEIEYDKIDALRGLNVSITTTAQSDDEARALLRGFQFPFKSN